MINWAFAQPSASSPSTRGHDGLEAARRMGVNSCRVTRSGPAAAAAALLIGRFPSRIPVAIIAGVITLGAHLYPFSRAAALPWPDDSDRAGLRARPRVGWWYPRAASDATESAARAVVVRSTAVRSRSRRRAAGRLSCPPNSVAAKCRHRLAVAAGHSTRARRGLAERLRRATVAARCASIRGPPDRAIRVTGREAPNRFSDGFALLAISPPSARGT